MMVPLRIDHSTLAIPSRMWLTSEYMVRTELKKVRGLLTSLEKGALSRIFSLPTAEMAQGLCIEVTGSQRTHLATFQIRIHICKSNSNMWKCLGLESIWFILYDVFVLFVTKLLLKPSFTLAFTLEHTPTHAYTHITLSPHQFSLH